jgi:hypothetical protein
MSSANAKAINGRGGRDRKLALANNNPASNLRYARSASADATRRSVPTLTRKRPMTHNKAPSNHGAVWTTKDFAAIRRLVKNGTTGKTIAKEIGRSVVALYQKASIEGISLSGRPALRKPIKAKKAKAAAASKTRRSR